jgi:hypothetical protein
LAAGGTPGRIPLGTLRWNLGVGGRVGNGFGAFGRLTRVNIQALQGAARTKSKKQQQNDGCDYEFGFHVDTSKMV